MLIETLGEFNDIGVDNGLVRTLLVDDFKAFRDFARTTLAAISEIYVIAEVSTGLDAISVAKALRPDLILLDVGLPDMSGLETAAAIQQVSSGSRILFVSQHDAPEIASAAMAMGAMGYVLKDSADRDLLTAVQAVVSGKHFISAVQ